MDIGTATGSSSNAKDKKDGVWMGIDLGTTHSTCAVWDTYLSRPKSIRLDIAFPIKNSSKRYGKLVPSAILLVERFFLEELVKQGTPTNTTEQKNRNLQYDPERIQWMLDHAIIELDHTQIISTNMNDPPVNIVALVGQAAFDILELAFSSRFGGVEFEETRNKVNDSTNDKRESFLNSNIKGGSMWDNFISTMLPGNKKEISTTKHEDNADVSFPLFFLTEEVNDALVVSFKRLLGKTCCTDDQLSSLPYEVVTHANHYVENTQHGASNFYIRVKPLMLNNTARSRKRRRQQQAHFDLNDDNNLERSNSGDKEGLLSPQIDNNENADRLIMDIPPSELTRICLLALMRSAERSLKSFRNKLHPPMNSGDNSKYIGNVVVGVPANYTRYQRTIVERAAKCCVMSSTIDGEHMKIVNIRKQNEDNCYVKTLTESTAAIMAYGLFTSSKAHTYTSQTQAATTSTTTTANRIQMSLPVNVDETTTSATPGNDDDNNSERYLTALVFDMGGGTTDVTIASMIRSNSSSNNGYDRKSGNAWTYHVLATQGDEALGGDDVDSILVNWFLSASKNDNKGLASNNSNNNEPFSSSSSNDPHRRELLRICCEAKELLCGDGSKDVLPKESVTVEWNIEGYYIIKILTQDTFNQLIQPIINRCEIVIDHALQTFQKNQHEDESTKTIPSNVIDEVILVGGGSRIPAIREMLQCKLFPNNSSSRISHNDAQSLTIKGNEKKYSVATTDAALQQKQSSLCTSLNPNAAVAHGCAIYATMESNLIPHHEIMSALMLDALPHSIGILVEDEEEGSSVTNLQNNNKSSNQQKQLFIEVLNKDTPLPASGYKTFHLSSIDQKGITVPLVELVGSKTTESTEPTYETIGQFSFLLHKLSKQQRQHLTSTNSTRSVDVAISVDVDGKITVSFFDWNDPEHLSKRQRYLKKQKQSRIDTGEDEVEDDTEQSSPMIPPSNDQDTCMLILSCILLLILYITVKIVFSSTDSLDLSNNYDIVHRNDNVATEQSDKQNDEL